MLNGMIRGGGVSDAQLRDDVRAAVYEAVAHEICEGVPSVLIAPQLNGIVSHKIKDALRNKQKFKNDVEYDPEAIDHRPYEPSTEDRYAAFEDYELVQSAMVALRDSAKQADRRHFAVLEAASRGESVSERLQRNFGEKLSEDAARHVLQRAREKLRELCGIPKNERAS